MKAYLNRLNEREKWMVLGTALCVFFYVYYLLLYAPLSSAVEQRSNQLIEKIDTLEWMKKVSKQKNATVSKKTVDNSQLLTLLATKLKNNESVKYPYQIQQTGSGEIQITFERVLFNQFVEWLAKINDDYAINVKQFEVSKTGTPGIAKLMIIISAAP